VGQLVVSFADVDADDAVQHCLIKPELGGSFTISIEGEGERSYPTLTSLILSCARITHVIQPDGQRIRKENLFVE
jgi:hypothetical protein